MSDMVKVALIVAVTAIVVVLLVRGPERVWCEVRGRTWIEAEDNPIAPADFCGRQ